MKNLLLIILLVLGLQRIVKAQNFDAIVTPAELDLKNYTKDTSAHAVYLNEFGKSRIDMAGDDNIRLLFEYHARIKIFDAKGIENGTISIPVFNGKEVGEEVDDIKGTTYYRDDDGQMRSVPFDIKNIFKVKDNKYRSTVKFAMPALRPGCVIDFKYKLTSPYINEFRNWDFQSNIPKIYSKYEVYIPAFWTFNASLRGSLKLSASKSEVERDCFTSHGAKCDCSHIFYDMKDIPAFIAEDYMTAEKNFISAIYFAEVEWTNPYSSFKTVVSKSWKDVEYQLKADESFGSQFKRRDLMKERIASVITGKTDELEKAKAIYTYLQKWFKWNDFTTIYSPDGIKKAYDAHTGTVGDINLCLAAALRAADINTELVVLSTRGNGNVNTLYPVLNDFNYVIVKINIGDNYFLLDATDPLLSFGLLPLKCLNDKGRVINLDKPSYWIELNGLQREKTTRALELTLMDNGKLKGTITNYYMGYDAYTKRKAIKNFNSVDEYIENLDEKLIKLKILKSNISNLDSLEMPLGETFDVEIDAFDNLNHNKLIFNPFLWEKITTNPFKLTERDYPVDWGMASEERLILTMHLPAQYSIETPPQSVIFKMPDTGGMYATNFENNDNTFTFSSLIRFGKAVYSSEEYPYLKEFYNKIILTEKADMIFKKK